MSYKISFIDTLRMFDIADKLYRNEIALTDGEMISFRTIYNQLDDGGKEFVKQKYGESMDFLENYEGVRKRIWKNID